MVPSKEMVEAIVKTLNESELEVKKMLQFGSSLDPEKFNNDSDIDFSGLGCLSSPAWR